MNNELQNTDTQQETLMKEINQGERNIRQVDWVTFLSDLVKAFRVMKTPVSSIGWAWALIGEIDEPTKRMDVLGLWQDAAPECFPTKEESDEFIAHCDCLVRINSRLRNLYIRESAQLPHIYDGEYGDKGLNELAMIWADNHVTGDDLVALASEIHRSVMESMRPPLIEQVLLSSRNYGHLAFDNIYDFSRNLFLAESFRKFLLDGKANSDAPMTFVDMKRKVRNACFDEYIRMRLAQIESEMENDNSLLLDPTTDDLYQELYNHEKSVVDREFMFEDFRGSQAYRERWYRGRPEVLQMMKYFMEYLKWKMEHLHDDENAKAKVIVNNGDYVAGDKITGDVIKHVEAGGIGKQVVYSAQQPKQNTSSAPLDKVAAAIKAVYEVQICDSADWAAVIKILKEQNMTQANGLPYDAGYINNVCDNEITSKESIMRSVIFTKIGGVYPSWYIKEGEESREMPGKLRKYLLIGKVFTEELNK